MNGIYTYVAIKNQKKSKEDKWIYFFLIWTGQLQTE